MAETRISVCDGKYTLIHDNGRDFRCLRYDEPWRDLVGDGMVLALVQEIEELRGPTTTPDAEILKEVMERRLARTNIHPVAEVMVEYERTRFEQAAYAHYLQRHADRKTTDCDEPVGTAEQLFWLKEDGTYGVLMLNASWWAWQEALR